VPKDIKENLEEYRKNFLSWLYDKENNHNYWIYENGEKFVCCYRSEALIEWLNSFVFANSLDKVTLLASNVNILENNRTSIYF
jgi:uncharacterized protein YgfB (UPF0149 family)